MKVWVFTSPSVVVINYYSCSYETTKEKVVRNPQLLLV